MTHLFTKVLGGLYWCLGYGSLFVSLSLLAPFAALGQVSGTVFRDFNGNGTYEAAPTSGTYTYGEPGVEGVVLTGYPTTGSPVSATTNALGQYTLSGLTGAVRVEFTTLGMGNYESFRGAASATSVQFVSAPATNIDLGVNAPDDYWNNSRQPVPQFAIPCYVNGSRTDATGGALPAIVQFGNDQDGFSITKQEVATVAQVGTVWGVGYQRAKNRYFFSSFLKRHSDLGPQGMGGIYIADASSNTYSITGSFTMQGVTPSNGGAVIDLGSVTRNATVGSDNYIASAYNAPNRDLDAFAKVGTVGFGDTDIDNNTQLLYTVNLHQKTLITLDVSAGTTTLNGASVATLGALTNAYSITALAGVPGCVNGQLRPWGLKLHKGRGYLGVVCDASAATQTAAPYFTDLKSYVLSFDLANIPAGFKTELALDMNYRDAAYVNHFQWLKWTSVAPTTRTNALTFDCQPILSSIDFDPATDDMNIAFSDRFGHQEGQNNYEAKAGSTTFVTAGGYGDLLHACYDESTGSWVIEGTNSCPLNFTTDAFYNTTSGYNTDANVAAGISSKGEFFDDRGADTSQENSMGATATIPGTGRMVSVMEDPFPSTPKTQTGQPTYYGSGGLDWFDLVGSNRGSWTQWATIYTSSSPGGLGKAHGLGDVEANLAPAPVEIGNRVWLDTNNNGIQDPNEPPLAGVSITLLGPGLPTGGSTVTTNTLGEYYFSSASGTNTAGYVYSLTGLTGGGSYSLSFPTSVSTANASLSSRPNSATGSNADQLDTDPNAGGLITFTLGQSGQNNFSYDAAYVPCSVSITATASACNPATNQYSVTGTVGLTGATAGTLTITDGTTSTTLPITASTTVASYTLTGLTAGAGSHTVTANLAGCSSASATYSAPASCSVGVALTVTPGACQSATNQYSISGTISLTNAVAGTAMINDGPQSTTVTVNTGATSVAYSLSGLLSNATAHTVTVSYTGKTAMATYTAPASCSVAPLCSVSAVATAGLCSTATNTFATTITATVLNPGTGTLTISDGSITRTFATTAGNANTFTIINAGLLSDGSVRTVTASLPGCGSATTTYTAPVSCSVAPVCSLSATATAGLCATATNGYSATVVVQLTNAQAGTLTVSLPGTTPISQTIAANTPSFTAIFTGLPADGMGHTATVSLPGCGTTTATYTAPTACSLAPVCSISTVAMAGTCQTATNTYSSTVVITVQNPSTGTLSVSDGAQTLTFSTTANAQNTITAVFQGLGSDGSLHSVVASLPGCSSATATYSAPASCSVAPVCSISAAASAGACTPTTNSFSSTVVVTVANPGGGQTLTVTDGTSSQPFTTTAGTSNTFTVVFPGLLANGAVHTVTVSLPGCGSATTTYTAPASCSVAPACSISPVVTVGSCASATNTYSATAVVTVQNPPSGGTLTVSTSGQTLTFSTTALSQNTFTARFNGLISDGANHPVVVSLPNCSTTTATYTAPASCSVAPVCSISAVANPGVCASATNTYSSTVLVTLTNPGAGTLTVTDGPASVTVSVPATTGQVSVPVYFNGLAATGSTHVVTVSLPGCSSVTATYLAPVSCSAVSPPRLTIDKQVNKSVARLGDVLTYTVVLTNQGSTSASNVVVRDSSTSGLRFVAGSASVPANTTFVYGSPVSRWTVATLGAGQSLSLTFQAQADSAGVLYNVASIPGDTAQVCTSVPLKICPGDEYSLSVAPGRAAYHWYKDGVLIPNQTSNVLPISQPGSYSLGVDNAGSACPDFSCCPLLVELDSLPAYQAVTVAASCQGNAAQNNAQLVLSRFNPAHTYQYSLGSAFNPAASLSGAPQVIPASGVLSATLANPGSATAYTVRVYNSSGCYTDVTVLLLPTVCACPVEKCVPFVMKQTRGPRRSSPLTN